MTLPLSHEQRRLLEVLAEEVGLVFDRSPANLIEIAAAMGYTSPRRAREALEGLVRAGVLEAKKGGRSNYRRYTVKEAA